MYNILFQTLVNVRCFMMMWLMWHKSSIIVKLNCKIHTLKIKKNIMFNAKWFSIPKCVHCHNQSARPIILSAEWFLTGHFSHMEGKIHFPVICLRSVTKINSRVQARTGMLPNEQTIFDKVEHVGEKNCHYFNQICRSRLQKKVARTHTRDQKLVSSPEGQNAINWCWKSWLAAWNHFVAKQNKGCAAENTHTHARPSLRSIVRTEKNCRPVSRVIKLGH